MLYKGVNTIVNRGYMEIIDTSRVQANYRITLTEKVRAKIGKLKVDDIIAFYKTPEGILIRKL